MNLMICTSHPNIVWVIKLRDIRWAGHVTQIWESRGVYGVFLGET